jgi:hypothetical protein
VLVQDTNGSFYGTASAGGSATYPCDDAVNSGTAAGCGTIFSLSLGPFVRTLPLSGKVGTAVQILGNNLTGATSVTFNGTAAAFTANSTGTAISTKVPVGATTGRVEVVTPGSTLTSNVNFRVL